MCSVSLRLSIVWQVSSIKDAITIIVEVSMFQSVYNCLSQDGDDSTVSSSQQGSRSKSDQKTRTKRQSSLPAPVSLSQSPGEADLREDGVRFSYRLASSTKYNILVDQTSNMGINMRWTNVKRALFRCVTVGKI